MERLPRLAELDLQRSFRTLGIASDGSDVDTRINSAVAPAAHHSIHARPACPPQPPAPTAAKAPAAAKVIARPKRLAPPKDHPMKNEWLKYVRKRPAEEAETGREWECTWHEVDSDGRRVPCDYKAKKHLVKRHLESKHLQLR